MTNDELLCWQALSCALNLNAHEPIREQTDEERETAYWDWVLAQRRYADVSADLDAKVFAFKV